jgi:hypothetical protein
MKPEDIGLQIVCVRNDHIGSPLIGPFKADAISVDEPNVPLLPTRSEFVNPSQHGQTTTQGNWSIARPRLQQLYIAGALH